MHPVNYTPIDSLIEQYRMEEISNSISKETEPASNDRLEYQVIKEHELPREVVNFIQAKKETADIPEDLQKLGVEKKETTTFQDTDSIKLPISDEEIEEGLEQPITSSFRWLAEFALYLLKKAHMTLKKIHGKVTRVIYK